MHSINLWKLSQSPNYVTNKDLVYPYSEVPYIGEYKLIRIPSEANSLIELVDYWGEGRINATEGISGFPDCYNINHQYQLVSNGPDTDRKIPNRIPVVSYINCNTSSYIKDNSVKVVTLMGAPINKSCAQDIARMVNSEKGIVVVYGFEDNSADIRNLDSALQERNIHFCHTFIIPDLLTGLTLFNKHKAYLNINDLINELCRNITASNYEDSLTICKTIKNNSVSYLIKDVVTLLINKGSQNLIKFAYKLWRDDNSDIVIKYFPLVFKLLMNESEVKIVSKAYGKALKLNSELDVQNDRLVLGTDKNESNKKIMWKFKPLWENNNVVFEIMNVEYNMYLKLDVEHDEYGDRKAWGDKARYDDRSKWKLQEVKVKNDLLFYITNKEYNQKLKLQMKENVQGDRVAWGNHGTDEGYPGYFGWYLTP